MKRTGLALSLVFVLGGSAAATPPAPDSDRDAPEGIPKREGEYGGVNPSSRITPSDPTAAPPRLKTPPKRTLTWIGFTASDGGSSELFFQAATPFSIQQRVEGATLIVVLEGLNKQTRNTRRPLDTRFFDTALARVTARVARATRARKGKAARPSGVELHITFKDPKDVKEATVRSETGKDGMTYSYLAFGPSSAPRPSAAPPASGSMSDPE